MLDEKLPISKEKGIAAVLCVCALRVFSLQLERSALRDATPRQQQHSTSAWHVNVQGGIVAWRAMYATATRAGRSKRQSHAGLSSRDAVEQVVVPLGRGPLPGRPKILLQRRQRVIL